MVKIIELGTKNSIINNFIAELRDVNIQNDRMRFRRNLERIGEAMALEISKSLEYKDVTITTPLFGGDGYPKTIVGDVLVSDTIPLAHVIDCERTFGLLVGCLRLEPLS